MGTASCLMRRRPEYVGYAVCSNRLLRSSLVLVLSLVLVGLARESQAQRAQWHTGRPALPQSLQYGGDSAALSPDSVSRPRFKVIPLGAVPGRAGTFLAASRSLNNEGEVTGWSYNGLPGSNSEFLSAVPFVWRGGKLHSLPLDGWQGAFAFAINDHDQVVGALNRVDHGDEVVQSAVIWDHGSLVNLAHLLPRSLASFATDVNDEGTVVGSYVAADTGAEVPFVLRKGKVVLLPLVTELVTSMFMSAAEPARINNFGEIVGAQFNPAFPGTSVAILWRWDGERYIARKLDVGDESGGHAAGINELGVVVGSSFADFPNDMVVHAFLWRGQLRDLGALAGDTDSFATGINDSSQIVGLSDVSNTTRAFLWERGKMVDLHSLVPAGTPPFNDNVAVNDRGEIGVVGVDHNLKETAFLLVPLDYNR